MLIQYNYEGLPENPVKKRRLDTKLTLTQFTQKTNLSLQVVKDVEKGLPANIPLSITKFFDSQFLLQEQYQNWRREKRERAFLPPVGLLSVSSDIHPFEQFRNQIKISIPCLSELLCVPRYVISQYECNQKTMPKVLRYFALLQAHLSSTDIARLANLGEVYYDVQEKKRLNELT